MDTPSFQPFLNDLEAPCWQDLQQSNLIEKVRAEFAKLAGDYWDALPALEDYLQTPSLGQQAGIVGALALARRAL